MNRNFCFFASVPVMIFCTVVVAPAATSNEITQDYQNEYNELADRISRADGHSEAVPTGYSLASEYSIIREGDRDPADVVLSRTSVLLAGLRKAGDSPRLRELTEKLALLQQRDRASSSSALSKSAAASREQLFYDAAALRRSVFFAAPAVADFDSLLYAVMGNNYYPNQGSWIHAIIQLNNYGFTATPCGGIYLLKGIKSGSPVSRDLLANSTVQTGRYNRYAGQKLAGRGAFNSIDLSYDGRTVLFSWVESPFQVSGGDPRDSTNWTEKTTFHVFKVNIDGSGLVQLTDGKYNDYNAIWLPGGRILFISERRRTLARCDVAPGHQPAGTMHSMKDDGSDCYPISWHELDEVYPSVDNDGRIVYTRWDYMDRDFNAGQNMWTCNPDGCDPRAPHGNYPRPWSTIPGSPFYSLRNGFADRPYVDNFIRAVPGTSGLYVATASSHHDWAGGPPFLINTNIKDDDAMAQITVFNPKWCFPNEGESVRCPAGCNNGQQVCRRMWTPLPLSADFFLVGQGLNINIMDRTGTMERIHTATVENHGAFQPGDTATVRYPIPVRPRAMPPALAGNTWQGERANTGGHYRATVSIMNIYESDIPFPAGTVIRELRIIHPTQKHWGAGITNVPRMGYADGAQGRMVLGTVPVEIDGSAYFEAPVGMAIYFQALDSNGMAVQSMRSDTYVHPGEQLTCFGCHEDKWKAPPSLSTTPLALKRAPSPIKPEPTGSNPMTFTRLVKPAIIGNCQPCHTSKKVTTINMSSYANLEPWAFYFHGAATAFTCQDNHGGTRSIPGYFGARVSKIGKAFLKTHIPEKRITNDAMRRFIVWLDANSMELASYKKPDVQRLYPPTAIVWPEVDVDSANPTGVERNRPLLGATATQKLIHDRFGGYSGATENQGLIDVRNGVIAALTTGSGPIAITIFDFSGRIATRTSLVNGSPFCCGSAGLSRGVYIVKASSKGTVMTTRMAFFGN